MGKKIDSEYEEVRKNIIKKDGKEMFEISYLLAKMMIKINRLNKEKKLRTMRVTIQVFNNLLNTHEFLGVLERVKYIVLKGEDRFSSITQMMDKQKDVDKSYMG